MPFPKQQTFLDLTCREALFGGSAGPGKSSGLLMAALQYVDVPGYAALLLRRTYADLSLPGALMDRAGEWLRPTAAKWHETEKTWVFPSGAKLAFGYLETEVSKYRYQSSEWQMVGWDELSQFTSSQYTYLFSRLRRLKGVEVPIRMRSATNPGSEWVRERFEIDMKRFEPVQWTHDGERAFVPARLIDNPALDADEYRTTMDQLDPVTRQQLLEGDWDVRPAGDFFRRSWFPIVGAAAAQARRVRAWDLAATTGGDWTCGLKLAGSAGRYWVEDMVRGRWTPHERDQVMRQTAALDGAGVPVVIEQEPGSAGLSVIADLVTKLAGYTVTGVRATGDKATRAGPFASQAQAGNVLLLEGAWNRAYLDELEAFPTKGVPDDQIDASSLAFSFLTQPSNPLAGLIVGIGVKGW